MSAWDAQGMWTDLNAGSSTSYTQRPVWMEKKVRWIGRSEGAGNDAQGPAGCTSGTACDKAQSNWLAQCAEHSSMQGATDLLRSHYAAQRITPGQRAKGKGKADRTSVHTLCSSPHPAHTRADDVAHLALGGVAVETRLGRPVPPALAVVHVHGEVEVEEVALHDMRLRGLGEHRGHGRCWRGRGGDDNDDEGRGCVGARDGGETSVLGGGNSILRGQSERAYLYLVHYTDATQKCKNAKQYIYYVITAFLLH